MRTSLRRVSLSSLVFGSVLFQILYSYFLFISDREALNDLIDGNEQTAILAVCITLAIIDSLESLLLVNPAEIAYKLTYPSSEIKSDQINVRDTHSNEAVETDGLLVVRSETHSREAVETDGLLAVRSEKNREKQTYYELCIYILQNYPLKSITFCVAIFSLLVKALTDSISIATWVPNQYAKIILSIFPLLFGTIYLTMLMWSDIIEHHHFIYSNIFSLNSSILWNAIKSPFITIELFLTSGVNALLASVFFSYAAITAKNLYLPKQNENSIFNIVLIGVVSFLMSHTTLFTRYLASHRLYFNPQLERYDSAEHSIQPTFKKSWLFNTILRFFRAAGIVYFVDKYLGARSIQAIVVSCVLSIFLILHSTYISYKRSLNQAKLALLTESAENNNDTENNATIGAYALSSCINGFQKIAYALAIYAAFKSINQWLELSLVKLDLVMLTLCFAIPSAINNFDYYNTKIISNLTYYKNKIQREYNQPYFGKACCFFRSTNEYPKFNTEAINPRPAPGYAINS